MTLRLDARARHVAAIAVARGGAEQARHVAENAEADPVVRAELARLVRRHGEHVPPRLVRRTHRSGPP